MITDEEFDTLAGTVAALKDRLLKLEGTAPPDGPPGGSFALTTLRDSNDAPPAAWRRLVHWVRSVAIAYQLDNHDLPQCWHEHGAYVRELAALHAAHRVAMLGPGRDGRAMVMWHNDLHNVLARLRSSHVGQRCATQHSPSDVVRGERTARIVNLHMRRRVDFPRLSDDGSGSVPAV